MLKKNIENAKQSLNYEISKSVNNELKKDNQSSSTGNA